MKKTYLILSVVAVLGIAGIGINYLKTEAPKSENSCAGGELFFQHPGWSGCVAVEGDFMYRVSDRDQGSFKKDGNVYAVHWTGWNVDETFVCDSKKVCVMKETNNPLFLEK